jgi:hypothetical protein
MHKLVFYLALAFAPLAAASAFIIAWAEYAKHPVDRKRVLKAALRMSFLTFIFFLARSGLSKTKRA